MSRLSETIRRLMAERRPRLNQGQVAAKAKMTPSHFSQILTGRQKHVAVKDVSRIAEALSKNPGIQADLIHAYLLDHIPPDVLGSKLIKCQIATASEDQPTSQTKLAPEVEKALDILREAIPHDPDMREMILRLARYCKT